MVNVIPFVVEGWHAPASRRAGNPGLYPGQAAPDDTAGGCQRNLGPADRSNPKTTSGVSRIEGQAGTQATDPTPAPSQTRGSRAGALIHILPADYARVVHGLRDDAVVRRWTSSVRAPSKAGVVTASGASRESPVCVDRSAAVTPRAGLKSTGGLETCNLVKRER